MARLSAHDLIDLVLDDGSWSSWDTAPSRDGVFEGYAAELAAAEDADGAAGWDHAAQDGRSATDSVCAARKALIRSASAGSEIARIAAATTTGTCRR